jgi:4-hydroxyphenylpyruvate dioxygenase
MTSLAPLGIVRLESLHYYVHDHARFRGFLVDKLGFAEFGRSSAALEQAGRQRSFAYGAGSVHLLVSSPLGEGGRAHRWLRRHPEGVGTLVFEVEDIARCRALLDDRGGSFLDEVQEYEDDSGTLRWFSITSPFGNVTFRFVERRGYRGLFPGFEHYSEPIGGDNPWGIRHVDHVTSNFETMKPALLWMEHVLGWQPYWEVEFHTSDVSVDASHEGSGLRSQVMWDPYSGVKFANNEPKLPRFKASQINVFHEQNRGDGVQHVALAVGDIEHAVRGLRASGLEFMPTPGAYYDLLPRRIADLGIGSIDEDVATLRDLEILVDGSGARSYLLQIFLKEQAVLLGDAEAGPFFFELIQRKGDNGFGAGNFRALFESIEREQAAAGAA